MAKSYVNAYQAAYEQSEQWITLQAHALHAMRLANTALRARVAELAPYAPAPKPQRAPRVVPPEEVAQLAKMAAAKDLAMRTKCTQRV